MLVTPSSTTRVVSEVQELKQFVPRLCTEPGIVIVESALQLAKALLPMVSSPLGNVMAVSAVQL